MEQRRYKAINFDLYTHELKKLYPGTNYRHAYYDIRFFFLKNNFIHRQGSGYVSTTKLTVNNIYNLIEKLAARYEWIGQSINKMDVTDVGIPYDLVDVFQKDPLD